ncbi:MAG: hypothetical protein ACK5LO_09865 [Leucobacter sp.]
MSSTGGHRQLEIAREAEARLRTLVNETHDLPNPPESTELLGELGTIVDHVTQLCEQVAAWHERVEPGTHYNGEDGGYPRTAAGALSTAADALKLASKHVRRAHERNAVVLWYPE